ncbi:MAG: hypothetical protein QXI54_07385 [Archaeoglobaceae archaeon]
MKIRNNVIYYLLIFLLIYLLISAMIAPWFAKPVMLLFGTIFLIGLLLVIFAIFKVVSKKLLRIRK